MSIRAGEMLEFGDIIECCCSDKQKIKFDVLDHEEFYNNETGRPLPKNKYCKYYEKTSDEIEDDLDSEIQDLEFYGGVLSAIFSSYDIEELIYEFGVKYSERSILRMIDEIYDSAVGYINSEDDCLVITLYNVRPSTIMKMHKIHEAVKDDWLNEVDEDDEDDEDDWLFT